MFISKLNYNMVIYVINYFVEGKCWLPQLYLFVGLTMLDPEGIIKMDISYICPINVKKII